jgi:hypothetical protein
MGFGYSMANVQGGRNLSPYLQVEKIDARWLEAIGYKGVKERKDRVATDGGRGEKGLYWVEDASN